MGSTNLQAMPSIFSAVVSLSDENYGSEESRIRSNAISQIDINNSRHSIGGKLHDDLQQINESREHNHTLTNPISSEQSNILEQLKEVAKMQHEDMKIQFENHGMEMEKKLQAHLDETKNRLAKTEEMVTIHVKEMKNEANIQHREIRRRFERVECKVNKGYFN